jgi:NAD(P)-dependent dehydrogenase (short-subunit alcohol dehydrogenase family)
MGQPQVPIASTRKTPNPMQDSVLITGGAQRLGRELVLAFARAGWHVWCHYRQSTQAAQALQADLRAQGLAIDVVGADLSQEAQVLAMMAQTAQQRGPVRAVVNNASLFEPDTGLDFDPALLRQQMEVNVVAPLLLGRELARQQARRTEFGDAQDACLIHVLDQKVFNLNPDYFSYTTTKLALERSVDLQAQALAPGVRVCGVAPGLIYPSGPQSQDNFDRASRVNLLRRATPPADVASTCLFLAQTRSITGVTVCVDSGQHLVPLARDVMFAAQTLFPEAHDAKP